MLVSDPDLVLIRSLYAGFFFGVLIFLLFWEDSEPLLPFVDRQARRWHRLRNLAMLFWVVLVADILIGQGVFRAQEFLIRPPTHVLDGMSMPLPAQVGLGLLASDLVDYWLHRASHLWSWFWRLHSVHHSDPHLDVTTAARVHPLETSVYIAAKLGLYVLLGLPFWIEGVRAILHNSILFIQHANVTYPRAIEKLGWLLVTPGIHRVHHDTERDRQDSNYGQIFSFWDRLFGTFRPTDLVVSPRMGLTDRRDNSWQTVWGMLATPFRGTARRDQAL